jgi:D-ribose pyranase
VVKYPSLWGLVQRQHATLWTWKLGFESLIPSKLSTPLWEKSPSTPRALLFLSPIKINKKPRAFERTNMKKTTLLQSDLSYIIATLGHLDTLVIADAGLPIPAETLRIDLALTRGVPGAVQTLKVILDEMKVEAVILAEEAKDRNPQFLADVQELLPDVSVEFVPHTVFKTRTASARAVVRTGEFAPYANVILVSGVVF